MNLNAKDTRYTPPKVLTSAVDREGLADGWTGGGGGVPVGLGVNTGPDFPPSRGVFSLISGACVYTSCFRLTDAISFCLRIEKQSRLSCCLYLPRLVQSNSDFIGIAGIQPDTA